MLISGCSTKYWTPWPLLQYLLEGFCRLLVLLHLHFFISQIGDCDPKDYLGPAVSNRFNLSNAHSVPRM